jgi:hypothetical protein
MSKLRLFFQRQQISQHIFDFLRGQDGGQRAFGGLASIAAAGADKPVHLIEGGHKAAFKGHLGISDNAAQLRLVIAAGNTVQRWRDIALKVIGVMAGALMGSTLLGMFRWEACEDPRELGRQVGGAALMGIGGVIAMGCSVGQGLSGIAALAWSGPVTMIAIIAGALFGLRNLIGGSYD